jgi:sulfofructose kinase
VASQKFALDFTGEKGPHGALAILARTAPAAVITLGEAGLVWASGHESGSLDAFPVDAVDTTGAGDVFHGAFALASARGEHLLSALRFAAAAAALACTKLGARASIPTKAEVEAFIGESHTKAAE